MRDRKSFLGDRYVFSRDKVRVGRPEKLDKC